MKIVYMPLDERPCNTIYPLEAVKTAKDIEVITPSIHILGRKKEPGNIKEIKNFLLEKASKVDAVVLSTEMLVYGGLVPSRLHHLQDTAIEEYKNTIDQLRKANPDLKIYVSNLIMRTPRYSSNDEEPDYYGTYGEQIFNFGWLKDKSRRDILNKEEEQQFKKIKNNIPENILKDYENRRHFNVQVNKMNVDLLNEGKIDFLVIPQDDAAEYGYTAMDQQEVFKVLQSKKLQNVMIYPGADEVGFTLLARAYQEFHDMHLKVFPFYSSTYGQYIIPNYEDRPINETLKAHIMAAGCELVYSADEADFVLAYNTPGKQMQEAWDQFKNKEVTYSSYRHLPTFVRDINNFIDRNIPVVLADSAYSNGGDGELIQQLDYYNLFNKLVSYKAWNTNGNTIGSSIAAGVLAHDNKEQEKIVENLILHFYEDFIYQSIVRMDVTNRELSTLNLDYFDLKEKKDEVGKVVKEKMLREAKKYLRNTTELQNYDIKIDFPWNRMFEIDIQINRK